MKSGNATDPTAPPIIAPKTTPKMKITKPPAPPEIAPQSRPIKGRIKIIECQESFSISVVRRPINLPEKYPTVAEIAFTKKNNMKSQDSSGLICPALKKILEKNAAGGKIPSNKPK